jgi:hypothetical protein
MSNGALKTAAALGRQKPLARVDETVLNIGV